MIKVKISEDISGAMRKVADDYWTDAKKALRDGGVSDVVVTLRRSKSGGIDRILEGPDDQIQKAEQILDS